MKKVLFAVGAFVMPGLALAQSAYDVNNNTGDIGGLLGSVANIINIVTVILVSVAVLMFIWGIIKYISSGGDEEKQAEARQTMIYGIIGLFVIVAMWGLVSILKKTFTDQAGNDPGSLPCIPGTVQVDGSLCQ